MRHPHSYGNYYWCLKLKNGPEVYLHADKVTNDNGALTFWRTDDDTDAMYSNMAVNSDQWEWYYAASVLDGHAVAVDHWKGQIIED